MKLAKITRIDNAGAVRALEVLGRDLATGGGSMPDQQTWNVKK